MSAPPLALSRALAALCALGAAFLAVRDLTLPAVRDVEVWFGVELHGCAALWTAPLHWALLAAGAWAWGTRRAWAARATALYLAYVALSHVLWSALHPGAEYARASLALAAACAAGALAFERAHRRARAR